MHRHFFKMIWMSPCSSWCEQSIADFVERIGIILIVLQSLWESQGPMRPQGPAIWFKWPRWNNRLAVRVKSHGRIGPSIFQKLMSTHPFWIWTHEPNMNKRDMVWMNGWTCPLEYAMYKNPKPHGEIRFEFVHI